MMEVEVRNKKRTMIFGDSELDDETTRVVELTLLEAMEIPIK